MYLKHWRSHDQDWPKGGGGGGGAHLAFHEDHPRGGNLEFEHSTRTTPEQREVLEPPQPSPGYAPVKQIVAGPISGWLFRKPGGDQIFSCGPMARHKSSQCFFLKYMYFFE